MTASILAISSGGPSASLALLDKADFSSLSLLWGSVVSDKTAPSSPHQDPLQLGYNSTLSLLPPAMGGGNLERIDIEGEGVLGLQSRQKTALSPDEWETP